MAKDEQNFMGEDTVIKSNFKFTVLLFILSLCVTVFGGSLLLKEIKKAQRNKPDSHYSIKVSSPLLSCFKTMEELSTDNKNPNVFTSELHKLLKEGNIKVSFKKLVYLKMTTSRKCEVGIKDIKGFRRWIIKFVKNGKDLKAKSINEIKKKKRRRK